MAPFELAVRKSPYKQEVVKRSWAATFPEDVKELSDSTKFITRCMYITFSHILACRRLLPTNVFKKRTIDGNLRAYVMDTSELLGARFVQKFKGVSDAVEKRYMHELILAVSASEESDEDAVEMYKWRMRYDIDSDPQAELRRADGSVMAAFRFEGMQHLKRQVAQLLLMIRALCRETLSPLPLGVSSTLRITYNSRTPKGYQAPGFHRWPEDPVIRPDAQEIEFTTIQTKHHGASVVVQSVFIDDAYAVSSRLRETMKLDGLDDSLNQSFDDEQGVAEEMQPQSNDTMDRITNSLVEQSFAIGCEIVFYTFPVGSAEHGRHEVYLVMMLTSFQETLTDVAEVAEGERIKSDTDACDTSTVSASIKEVRGSTITSSLSETTLSEAPRPRRGRRGQPPPIKVKPGQPVVKRASSPVIVSASPVLAATPDREMKGEDSSDTPPAKRTPGVIYTSKITPKTAPKRKEH